MVQLYIGDGKGKTTAAFGLALRALGWGKKVYIGQFLKDGRFPCGECKALNKSRLKLTFDRFSGQSHPVFSSKDKFDREKVKRSVAKALNKVDKAITTGKYDLVILDEVLNALTAGFFTQARLKRIIKKVGKTELVLTGRDAPAGLIKSADYVSLISKIKHPFDRKILARKSIEY